MIKKVFRGFRFGLGYTLIIIGILWTLFILYGTLPLQLLEIPESSIIYSFVLPVIKTGIQGLIPSIISLLAGLFIFRSSIKKLTPRAIFRFPIIVFRGAKRFRNWFLEKVDYLQSESEKWKRVFQVLKSPYSLLRAMGLSPQMATSLLIGASTVGGGVVVNETILEGRSFSRGDSGIYAAPSDAPVEWKKDYNTLRIDLASTPVREITIKDVSLGTVFTGSALPSGQQNVVDIGGVPASSGFVATKLEIGTLIFERSRCKKLELSNIQTHTLIIRGNASDGMSLAPSAGLSRMRAIGGGHHQAEAMITSGGTYDRLWIQAPLSGINGKVDKLTLSNLYTKGGICKLSNINAGTVEILLNEIGDGTGFATKEFTIATSVTAVHMTIEDNVEVTIAEPATQ
jgi:hypothetical protein